MADNNIDGPDGATIISAPALGKIVRLLRLIGGDPALSDRAVFLGTPVAVVDTAVSVIDEAQDESQEWSIAMLQFTAGSGLGRYDPTGGQPTATGSRGLQFASGGGMMIIRGVWNIRKFRIIAETGNAMSFTPLLFKTSVWSTGILKEN